MKTTVLGVKSPLEVRSVGIVGAGYNVRQESLLERRKSFCVCLTQGIQPEAVKEMVYQSTDYVGMGRMWPFLQTTNEVFAERGHHASGQRQSCNHHGGSAGKRRAGAGGHFWPADERSLEKRPHQPLARRQLFGDYYTRTGLDLAQREMITFCFLMAQGGCEPQLTAHAKGNMNLGNDKEFLLRVVSQCLPYIGYPRSLNAVTCINKAAE